MKVTGITGTAFLSLLLGIAAYAQHEQQGEKQDHQEQSKHEQAKPEQQHAQQQRQSDQQQRQPQRAQQQQRQDQNNQQRARQQQQGQQQQRARQQQQSDQSRQQAQRAQQRQGQSRRPQIAQQQDSGPPHRTQAAQRVQQSTWQQHRAQSWQSDHRTWQQRGGYSGYRIPDDHFRGSFGPEHGFRIYGRPFLVVGGYPRFQYNGYWFSLVDPWPEYWANDWYDTDDVYVSYVDNGYYLFDRRYPTVGIAISISM